MAFDDKTDRAGVSAVPLYQQVMDDLKGEIARGVYPAGSRIPAEMELAKSYGVGRVTVRRAIEELSRAGYLNRQQGRGTFVCAPKLKRKIRQKGDVQSFTEGCAANDMVPGARLVSRTVVAATHEDAAFFGVEPGCELIVVERVRTADGIPVMLENNAFVLADHPYLQTLADEDLTDNSIFALVAEHSGSRAAQVRPLHRGDCACRYSDGPAAGGAGRRAALLYGGLLYRRRRAPSTARPPKDRGLALRLRHLTSTDRTT